VKPGDGSPRAFAPFRWSWWWDVLEQTFMIRRLPPCFTNTQKRLTRSPKLCVRDTGLLHLLAGVGTPGELETWDRRRASFEGQAGGEVDLLLVRGRRITAIEIKSASHVDPRDLRSLRVCMQDLGLKRAFVVYRGRERLDLGHGIDLIPWAGGRCAESILSS